MENETEQTEIPDPNVADENMTTFIFGNILIRDPDTNEVLVNLRF